MTFNCVGVDGTGEGDPPQGVLAALPCPNTFAGMRFSECHFLGVDPAELSAKQSVSTAGGVADRRSVL